MRNAEGLIATMSRIEPPLTAAIIVDPNRALHAMERTSPQRAHALRRIAIESPHIQTIGDDPEAGSKIITEASDAFTEIGRSGTTGTLTEGQKISAEAVIMLFGRPAIQFNKGQLQEIPDEWKQRLKPHRTAIQRIAKSVGRIEPAALPGIPYLGTGFMVGPDTIMTNRHVANFIAGRSGEKWTIKTFTKPRMDFRAETTDSEPAEFSVVDVISMSDDDSIDLALLKVEATTHKLPPPVPLATSYKPKPGSSVYVVGHPQFDDTADQAQRDIQRLVFEDVFDVKRVAPGYLLKTETGNLAYDSSTLGGNSGSCVVDLATQRVVGLHFGGTYLEANYAVPLWKMRRRKIVSRFGLNFVTD